MRTTPRPRHHINPVAFALLRPVLRFSYTREAYVLRVVGNHRGPVFVRARTTAPHAPAEEPRPSAEQQQTAADQHRTSAD